MNRIVNNYTTTILGVALVIYCCVMVFRGSAWGDMAGFFGMAGLLLRSKDSLIGINRKEKNG